MTNEQELKERISLLEGELNEQEERQKIKDQFFATTVHELRTPLNAIVGLSTILVDSDIKEPLSGYISQIHTSSELLVSLVNDILDFSKIEAGKIEIENISFSLESIIDNISTIVGIQAKQKGLELLFEMDDTIPVEILGDPLRLTQVLINLTSNAVKFTHDGTIVVRAKLLPNVGKRVYIEFCISDTGIGLTQEQTDRLFENFMQGHSSISREYGGSGLGLSISKKLIELMGGSIRVESEIDKGSNFIFTIELRPIVSNIIKSDADRRKNLREHLEKFKDAHILLVEDNTANQSIIVALLKGTGIEITIANDGQEALDVMSEDDGIDLILMDVNMPIMGGIEATTILRSNPKYWDMPIIAFSGDSSDTAVAKIKDAGMNAIISKPIVVEEFYQVLKNHLRSEQTIEQRYIESAKQFDSWLEKYKYQKIMSLVSSIKKEIKTKDNEAILKSALFVESAIEKYKNLFLVLIKNHTRAVKAYIRCIHTLEEQSKLTKEQNEQLSLIMNEYNKEDNKELLLFADKLEHATEELIALVNILRFNKATEFAHSLQEEAKSLGVRSIVSSISPIVGIEATQRNQLRVVLRAFRDEIEKIQRK